MVKDISIIMLKDEDSLIKEEDFSKYAEEHFYMVNKWNYRFLEFCREENIDEDCDVLSMNEREKEQVLKGYLEWLLAKKDAILFTISVSNSDIIKIL